MSQSNGRRPAVAIIVIGAVLLCALHQDQWWWDDGTLVFGFMPIALAYHVLYSILAALLWATACVIAWPRALEVDDAPGGGAEAEGRAG